MTAFTVACVESVKHASSDRKDGCELNRSLFMNLGGKTQRQLRRWEMSESCGVQDGAGGIQVCGTVCVMFILLKEE